MFESMTEPNSTGADTPVGPAEKDPADWTTGDEPMTGPQKSYLETLSQQAGREAPGDDLTKADAARLGERRERAGPRPRGSGGAPRVSGHVGGEPAQPVAQGAQALSGAGQPGRMLVGQPLGEGGRAGFEPRLHGPQPRQRALGGV